MDFLNAMNSGVPHIPNLPKVPNASSAPKMPSWLPQSPVSVATRDKIARCVTPVLLIGAGTLILRGVSFHTWRSLATTLPMCALPGVVLIYTGILLAVLGLRQQVYAAPAAAPVPAVPVKAKKGASAAEPAPAPLPVPPVQGAAAARAPAIAQEADDDDFVAEEADWLFAEGAALPYELQPRVPAVGENSDDETQAGPVEAGEEFQDARETMDGLEMVGQETMKALKASRIRLGTYEIMFELSKLQVLYWNSATLKMVGSGDAISLKVHPDNDKLLLECDASEGVSKETALLIADLLSFDYKELSQLKEWGFMRAQYAAFRNSLCILQGLTTDAQEQSQEWLDVLIRKLDALVASLPAPAQSAEGAAKE